MELKKVFGTISLEESEFMELKQVESGFHHIELSNELGKVVDGTLLAEYFRKVQGIDKIDCVTITFTSKLENVLVIKGFPNLLTLVVKGHNIRSFDGLCYFKKGIFLWIKTEKNRQRIISEIDKTPITKLDITYENAEDYGAISKSRTINDLELKKCPSPVFNKWIDVPLESLQLTAGNFVELGDIALVKTLRTLVVERCKKFERFVGDNSNVTWMLLDGCSKLEIDSIRTCKNVEVLTFFAGKKEYSLSAFKGLNKLKSLNLIDGKVNIDIHNLKEIMPSLEELHVSSLKKEQVLELSQLNEGVKISR